MGVLKLKVPGLCLLLLMPLLLLVPGSEAEDYCMEFSKTYTSFVCALDTCVQHCHDEGFPKGECRLISFIPMMSRCFCIKPC